MTVSERTVYTLPEYEDWDGNFVTLEVKPLTIPSFVQFTYTLTSGIFNIDPSIYSENDDEFLNLPGTYVIKIELTDNSYFP